MTSAVWSAVQGTALASFGHGAVVFSCRFAPVRQSPTWSWLSVSSPTVGVAWGEALCVWGGGALVEDPAFGLLEEPDPSVRTSTTTIATTAAAAPAGISHFGRLRGRCAGPPPGADHSPGTLGVPGAAGPPGCWPPHQPPWPWSPWGGWPVW